MEALEYSSTVKKLLGEDSVMAEFKGQNGFMFKNYSKLLFSTNMLPVITTERTNGFYRRLLILKMDRLEKFDIAEAGLFRGGLNNYKEHNYTSIVEHLAKKRIEAEERYKKHLAEIEEMYRNRLERNSHKPEK